MSKITVKSEFLSDLRRFPVNIDIGFKDFVQTVSKLYKLDNIRLKYRDDEGDAISITNDEELTEAIGYARNNKRNILRLIVSIGPNSSLLESWIVVEKLPEEVREICNDIKSLSNQLRVSRENVPQEETEKNNNNNNNQHNEDNAPKIEIAPTAAQFLYQNETNRPKEEESLSKSILSAQLPSWGKNSMYSEDFVRELNAQNTNNNNNNNNNGLLEGQRTDLVFQKKNEIEEKPKATKISQVVSENSASIVKDLKALTSKIATLVIQSGTDIPLDVKDDLIQTNMKLAEMTIANCQTYSNNALETCNQSSAMALNFVNSALDTQKKQNVENEISKKNLDQVCDNLRHDTIESCTNLSNTTAENCMKGANSIRDLIMNL